MQLLAVGQSTRHIKYRQRVLRRIAPSTARRTFIRLSLRFISSGALTIRSLGKALARGDRKRRLSARRRGLRRGPVFQVRGNITRSYGGALRPPSMDRRAGDRWCLQRHGFRAERMRRRRAASPRSCAPMRASAGNPPATVGAYDLLRCRLEVNRRGRVINGGRR